MTHDTGGDDTHDANGTESAPDAGLAVRLTRLDSAVGNQPGRIEAHAEGVGGKECPDGAAEADDGGETGSLTRRGVLTAGGLLALLGLSARPAAADPQGQVGTDSDPLTGLYTQEVNSGAGSLVFNTAGGTPALTLGTPGTDSTSFQSTGGANVVAGYENNAVTGGAVGATISGGGSSGSEPVDGSSRANTNEVAADYGTIGGGRNNRVPGFVATVGGGEMNTADDIYATVGGGISNTASAVYATVGGGDRNTASLGWATVGGGDGNTASGPDSTVSGGGNNTASAVYATVGGGKFNIASSESATVGGGGDSGEGDVPDSAGGGIRTNGNQALGDFCTIAGGIRNQAGDSSINTPGATVGGGEANTASDQWATVSGGNRNTAGFQSTVGGGSGNTASGSWSTVGGGNVNTASGLVSTVGGGSKNTASNSYATVPGGEDNVADGVDSFAAGRRAKANHDGAFVWADSQNVDFASTDADQFLIKASGGVGLGTNAPVSQLHVSDSVREQGATNLGRHVAVVENTKQETGADILGLKSAVTDPSGFNNFVSFQDAESLIGQISGNGSGGVNYRSASSDLAEYFPTRDPDAEFEAGSVVGLSEGELVADPTEGSEALVVSDAPMVTGNEPTDRDNDTEGSACVALLGQVPVRIDAAVEAGDLLVAAPDGHAIPETRQEGDNHVVGRALEHGEAGETVETFVSVRPGGAGETGTERTAADETEGRGRSETSTAPADRVADLEGEVEALRAENERLRERNDALEARLAAVEGRLAGLEGDQSTPATADD